MSQESFFDGPKGAIFSDCNKYRYLLHRAWDIDKPWMLFIMLNPSTADDKEDDPTIRRCISFAKTWGYGGFWVCNLFALRSKSPADLLSADDPIGPGNWVRLKTEIDTTEMVVCAWGNQPTLNKYFKATGRSLDDLLPETSKQLYAIDLSKEGTPKHPLYLKSNLRPIPFKSLF